MLEVKLSNQRDEAFCVLNILNKAILYYRKGTDINQLKSPHTLKLYLSYIIIKIQDR